MRFLLGIFLVLFSLPAFAADISRKAPVYSAAVYPPVSWTGLYVGINGGYGYQREDEALAGTDKLTSAIVASGFVPSSIATRGGGGMIGGTVGYNYQVNPSFVVGAAGDIDWADISGSGGQAEHLGPFALTTAGSVKTNWMGSLRARAGYLLTPSTLLYVTGGGAVAGVDSAASVALVTPIKLFNGSAAADTSSVKWGWTVGGGLEQQLWGNWSVKGEYRYTDLGTIDSAFATTIGKTQVAFTSSQPLRYHTFLAGVNYRFGGL